MAVAKLGVNFDDQEAQLSSSSIGECSIMQRSKMLNSIDDTGTLDLQNLWINNIVTKLRNPGQYDIGGCSQESLDLWFFFTTSICPGDNYLLNIFVCNLKPSFVSLEICSKNTLMATEKGCILSDEFEKITMIKNQTNNHLRTYRFSDGDITLMEANGSVLRIPIKVNVCSEFSVQDIHPSIKNKIKLEHNFGSLLSKDNKFDYTLISMNGNKYDVHKIVLIAHSPVLKELINKTKDNFIALDLDDDYIKVIIEFLYTGILAQKQQMSFSFKQLLDIAEKYEIRTLSAYTETILSFDKPKM